MAHALRLFVALSPGAASRPLLAREARRLAGLDRAARATKEDNLHFTLAFLGATAESEVATIEAALAEAAACVEPFSVRVAGLGAFPGVARPRVIWAGVESGPGTDAMRGLAVCVAAALAGVGHRVEDAERFHPHVTLARVDGPLQAEAIRNLLTRGTLQDTYSIEVLSDLLLMVSENDGKGTRYRALAVIPLGTRTRPQTESGGAA